MAANDYAVGVQPAPGYTNAGKVSTVTPTLGSLNPATAVRNTTVTVHAIGTGFTRSSTIVWNGVRQPTTYVSATDISASITLPNAAGTPPVKVEETPDLVSAAVNFTIT